MKSNTKTLIIALVLVVVMIAAALLYSMLTAKIADAPAADNAAHTEEVSSAEAEDSAGSQEEKIPAPDFTIKDGDGNDVRLSDFLGKPIVLNFWATWCGPCQMEMPYIEDAYLEKGGDIHFLAVNLTDGSRDTVDSVKAFIEESGYTFPVYYDTDLSAAMSYGAYSIPLTVFIDSEGNVLTAHTGAMSEETLAAYLELFD